MIYNVCICDSDDMMLKLNKMYLDGFSKNTQFEFFSKCFFSGPKLIQYAKENNIDIAILETKLNTVSGIDVAKYLKQLYPDILIIFITKYREYVLEAISSLEIFSILFKPLNVNRFDQTLKRAIIQVNAVKDENLYEQIVITENNIKQKIFQQNIVYIEKRGAQCVINTYKNQYRVYETVSSLIKRLNSCFIRINQSIIVNIREIASLKSDIVTLKNGINLYIGRTYKNDVRKKWISNV